MAGELEVLDLGSGFGEVVDASLFAQAAPGEIFVNDLRVEGDQSFDLVPRITDYARLKDTFGLDVDYGLGFDSVPDGQLYWALVGFYLRVGAAAFIPKVLDEAGNPLPDIFVFAWWPSAPPISNPNPAYHQNGVGGFTNANGDVGFGYGGSAVAGPGGGVYEIWVSADPPNGTRFYSDNAIRLGWFGGTDHLTPNPIFQVRRKQGEVVIPSPTAARLVIYDNQGNAIGAISLSSGSPSEDRGRIAVEIDGVEIGHVRYD